MQSYGTGVSHLNVSQQFSENENETELKMRLIFEGMKIVERCSNG
jgi:hypothetical protein